MDLLDRFTTSYNRVENIIARVIFRHLFPRLASDRLTLVRRLRTGMKIATPLTVILLAMGLLVWNSKAVTAAGLFFDIIGVCRIFLDDEGEELLESFKDEEEYPFGPPSYVMRELMDDYAPDVLDDRNGVEPPEISHYFFWHRGMFLLLLGFVFQLLGALMG